MRALRSTLPHRRTRASWYRAARSDPPPLTVLITTRACLIAADLLVLVVTWRHTYKLRREASAISLKTPMVTLLLRDGA